MRDSRCHSGAIDIRKQLRRYCKQFNIPMVECRDADLAVKIRKAIICGFFANAAQMQAAGHYRTVRGNQELHIHPNSILHRENPMWVVYHEVVLTTKKYMREVTAIEPMWLCDLAPHFYEFKSGYSTSSGSTAAALATAAAATASNAPASLSQSLLLYHDQHVAGSSSSSSSSNGGHAPRGTAAASASFAIDLTHSGDGDDGDRDVRYRPAKQRKLGGWA
jgi:HrpA-like RNA helicase